MSYKHLSITERELIYFHLAQGKSRCQIAKLLGTDKSTICRELNRNSGDYSPSKATANYYKRRKKCCPHKKLANAELFTLVATLFLSLRWSPEQIANRPSIN